MFKLTIIVINNNYTISKLTLYKQQQSPGIILINNRPSQVKIIFTINQVQISIVLTIK